MFIKLPKNKVIGIVAAEHGSDTCNSLADYIVSLDMKQEQMLIDYSEIISQFIILMGAGMTAKNVWKKIVEDYRKQEKIAERCRNILFQTITRL